MLPVVETVDLCPVVHVVHPFLLPSTMTGGSVENPTRCGRCQGFDRREVSSIQPASTGNVVIDIAIEGLKGRELVASGPSVSLWPPPHTCQEDKHKRRHAL